jgi:hypothetical protein
MEIPILQELSATGGTDDIRFLYERLIAYFPQINDTEIKEIKTGASKGWRKIVQKTGKILEDKNLVTRSRGIWTLTEKGKIEIATETSGFTLIKQKNSQLSHDSIQNLLCDIGESLLFHTQKEVEFYDVVWRESAKSPRFSHVFEVQSKGNIDSAFAKLKRAYQAQRTKPFLIVSSETNLNRSRKSLAREFQDIESVVTILTFEQIKTVHQNLQSTAEILKEFLLK